MTTLDQAQIRQRALKRNGIDFLKSEAAAKAAAARFKEHLGRQLPPGTIHVGESPRHSGTWRVGFYHLTHAPVSYGSQQINIEESRRVAEAFQAVFRSEELVTTWTRPSRNR